MEKQSCVYTKNHWGSEETFEFGRAACLIYDNVITKKKHIFFPTEANVFNTLQLFGNELTNIRLKK